MPDQSETADREILTYELFGRAARELATTIAADGYRPDAIIGIARGGLTLAGALGYALNVKMLGSLNVEFYTDVEQTLEAPVVLPPTLDQASLAGKSILLVDDTPATEKDYEGPFIKSSVPKHKPAPKPLPEPVTEPAE